jgi:hypothetical protein
MVAGAGLAEGKTLYEQDFSKAAIDQVPDDLLVLDGQFAVKDDAGNKLLELPGAPLDTFGVAFGPNQADGVELQARIRGSKTGRKFPTFAAGLNGVAGYKLRVAPSKNALELVKGDDVKTTVPFQWKSGEWMRLKLRVVKTGNAVNVQGKAWQGNDEPKEWPISFTDNEPLAPGKAGVWGMPFSGTAIQFDDLKIVSAE